MLTGGLYHKPSLRPQHGYRIFNTWCGDPGKVVQMVKEEGATMDLQVVLLGAVLETIAKERLLEGTLAAGAALVEGLGELEGRFPHLLANTRGRGTFCAVDCSTTALRSRVMSCLWKHLSGIQSQKAKLTDLIWLKRTILEQVVHLIEPSPSPATPGTRS